MTTPQQQLVTEAPPLIRFYVYDKPISANHMYGSKGRNKRYLTVEARKWRAQIVSGVVMASSWRRHGVVMASSWRALAQRIRRELARVSGVFLAGERSYGTDTAVLGRK